jgi:hypothetical protein
MHGTIVLESLDSPEAVEGLEILSKRFSEELDWHIYIVEATEEQISTIANVIKKGWYAHFWKGNQVIAVFRNRMFLFNHSDKRSWHDAVAYGRSVGIPEEQLDFPIDDA